VTVKPASAARHATARPITPAPTTTTSRQSPPITTAAPAGRDSTALQSPHGDDPAPRTPFAGMIRIRSTVGDYSPPLSPVTPDSRAATFLVTTRLTVKPTPIESFEKVRLLHLSRDVATARGTCSGL
jgi:hypothetical protein